MAACNSAIQVRFSNRSDNPERLHVHRKADSDSEGRISFRLDKSDDVEEASEANDEVIFSSPSSSIHSEPSKGAEEVVEARHSLLASTQPLSAAIRGRTASQRSAPAAASQREQTSKTILSTDHSSARANLLAPAQINDEKEQNNNKDAPLLYIPVDYIKEMEEKCSSFVRRTWHGYRKISSVQIRLLILSIPLAIFLLLPNFLSGLFVGVYVSLMMFFHVCVSDPMPIKDTKPQFQDKVLQEACLKSEEEDKSGRVYKGWMNILNEHYHPHRFHVNTIQTVLVRLDGNLLRISRPDRSLLKHAFHTDPTLTEPEPRMLSQNIYDLTNATVKLRPRRLARRRWFSRKYPICVRLGPTSQNHQRIRLSSSTQDAQLQRRRPPRRRVVSRSVASDGGSASGAPTPLSGVLSTPIGADFGGSVMEESVIVASEEVGQKQCAGSQSLNSYSTVSTTSAEVAAVGGGLKYASTVSSEEVLATARELYSDADTDGSTTTCCSDVDEGEERGMSRSVSEFIVPSSSQPIRPRPSSLYSRQKSKRRLFLFARSSREKERWFHRLRKATSKYLLENSAFANVENYSNSPTTALSSTTKASGWNSEKRQRFASLPSFRAMLSEEDASKNYLLYILTSLQFSKHLEDILPGSTARQFASMESGGGIVAMDLGRNKWSQPDTHPLNTGFIAVVNLLASRIFYDFCRDEYWIRAVQKKIQTKLATIHLPHFVETLELSNFDIGTVIPRIVQVYPAIIDDWGIWIDFEVKYEGLIRLMIETKVNLMKLKEDHGAEVDQELGSPLLSSAIPTSMTRREPSRYSDDEIPESPETSPDEEFGTKLKMEEFHAGARQSKKKGGQKLLNWVDKITQSKYFKEASELKPIRKVMEEISSTRLILNVEVTALEGTMTVNMPPPPSDRLWYGFRKPPKMSVRAVPQVGVRSVAVSALSDWIEAKIKLLLEKNLVAPNLDDVVVPVLSGNVLLKGPLNL